MVEIPNKGNASSRTATVPLSPDGETMYSELEGAVKKLVTPLPHDGFLEVEVLSLCTKCGGSALKPLNALVDLKELFEGIKEEETIKDLLGSKITEETIKNFLSVEMSTMLNEMAESGQCAAVFQYMQPDPGIVQ